MNQRRICLVAAALVAIAIAPARGQFTKTITDFEGSFPGGTFVAEVMFEDPGFSGTTRGLDAVAGNDSYLSNKNDAPSPFTEVHSGNQGYVSYWGWKNANDHTSWVRLVTTNVQSIPNPALHLGGKVRMWMAARAFTDASFATQVPAGSLYVTLGVRETGVGVPKGGNGGITGDIEWAGINQKLTELVAGTNGLCNTTANASSDDVQVIANGGAAGVNAVCISPGTNGLIDSTPASDDNITTTPVGMNTIPADGVMRQYVFDLPALQAASKVIGFTGNGTLSATPNNRGTLEHLALVNNPANGPINAKVFILFIDDVEFESPIIDPPVIPVIPAPPRPLNETVTVQEIAPTAANVTLVQLPSTVLGSVNPAGATTLNMPTSPLPSNVQIVARQTIGANTSDDSAPVAVVSAGNGPLRMATAIRETDQYDHNLGCGANGTGFDANQPSTLEFIGATSSAAFGVPDGKRYVPETDWFEVTFDPCVDGVTVFSGNGEIFFNSNGINSNALTMSVWEGLYFRIDATNPTDGPFTVYLDDLVLKNANGVGQDCVVDDFESYTVEEVITEGATAGTADSVATGDDIQVLSPGSATFAGQIIITSGPNKIIDTVPASGEGKFSRHARFNYPGASGTSVGVATSPNLSAVTDAESFSGSKSLKVQWAFVNATNLNNVLRLTTNGSTATNPPEALANPDPTVNVQYAGCNDGVPITFSVMMKFEPPPVPGDCDKDGDVDLVDAACFQRCFGESPVSAACVKVSLAPNGNPDNVINLSDYNLFSILLSGPK